MDTLFRNWARRLAVVIPAMNEEDRIGDVLRETYRLAPDQVVVVVNGTVDRTAEIARSFGADVLEYSEPLGNDVGRAIGAIRASADTYLFIDADIVIPAEDMLPFVLDIENGADVALNGIDWVARHPRPHAPAVDRYFLNLVQGRRDLGVENVLTVPHAFSANALARIGKDTLANPQLANAIAIERKLRIVVSHDINVLLINKVRNNHFRKSGERMPSAYQRMHGDSVEACAYLLDSAGRRAGFGEGGRKRWYYDEISAPRQGGTFRGRGGANGLSVVLSVPDTSVYLAPFLAQLAETDVEVVPVVHGTSPKTRSYLKKYGFPFIDIPEFIGHDTAFAIGAEAAGGELLVFHDTAIPVDYYELEPYVEALKRGIADIAVNKQSPPEADETPEADGDEPPYVGKLESMHPAQIGGYFLNLTFGTNELGASSMLLPPYAMKRSVLETIGAAALIDPGAAQAKAAMERYEFAAVGRIDVSGRINEAVAPIVLNHDRILGDAMEGVRAWTAAFGARGGFIDGGRRRELLADSASGAYRIDPHRPPG